MKDRFQSTQSTVRRMNKARGIASLCVSVKSRVLLGRPQGLLHNALEELLLVGGATFYAFGLVNKSKKSIESRPKVN